MFGEKENKYAFKGPKINPRGSQRTFKKESRTKTHYFQKIVIFAITMILITKTESRASRRTESSPPPALRRRTWIRNLNDNKRIWRHFNIKNLDILKVKTQKTVSDTLKLLQNQAKINSNRKNRLAKFWEIEQFQGVLHYRTDREWPPGINLTSMKLTFRRKDDFLFKEPQGISIGFSVLGQNQTVRDIDFEFNKPSETYFSSEISNKTQKIDVLEFNKIVFISKSLNKFVGEKQPVFVSETSGSLKLVKMAISVDPGSQSPKNPKNGPLANSLFKKVYLLYSDNEHTYQIKIDSDSSQEISENVGRAEGTKIVLFGLILVTLSLISGLRTARLSFNFSAVKETKEIYLSTPSTTALFFLTLGFFPTQIFQLASTSSQLLTPASYFFLIILCPLQIFAMARIWYSYFQTDGAQKRARQRQKAGLGTCFYLIFSCFGGFGWLIAGFLYPVVSCLGGLYYLFVAVGEVNRSWSSHERASKLLVKLSKHCLVVIGFIHPTQWVYQKNAILYFGSSSTSQSVFKLVLVANYCSLGLFFGLYFSRNIWLKISRNFLLGDYWVELKSGGANLKSISSPQSDIFGQELKFEKKSNFSVSCFKAYFGVNSDQFGKNTAKKRGYEQITQPRSAKNQGKASRTQEQQGREGREREAEGGTKRSNSSENQPKRGSGLIQGKNVDFLDQELSLSSHLSTEIDLELGVGQDSSTSNYEAKEVKYETEENKNQQKSEKRGKIYIDKTKRFLENSELLYLAEISKSISLLTNGLYVLTKSQNCRERVLKYSKPKSEKIVKKSPQRDLFSSVGEAAGWMLALDQSERRKRNGENQAADITPNPQSMNRMGLINQIRVPGAKNNISSQLMALIKVEKVNISVRLLNLRNRKFLLNSGSKEQFRQRNLFDGDLLREYLYCEGKKSVGLVCQNSEVPYFRACLLISPRPDAGRMKLVGVVSSFRQKNRFMFSSNPRILNHEKFFVFSLNFRKEPNFKDIINNGERTQLQKGDKASNSIIERDYQLKFSEIVRKSIFGFLRYEEVDLAISDCGEKIMIIGYSHCHYHGGDGSQDKEEGKYGCFGARDRLRGLKLSSIQIKKLSRKVDNLRRIEGPTSALEVKEGSRGPPEAKETTILPKNGFSREKGFWGCRYQECYQEEEDLSLMVSRHLNLRSRIQGCGFWGPETVYLRYHSEMVIIDLLTERIKDRLFIAKNARKVQSRVILDGFFRNLGGQD